MAAALRAFTDESPQRWCAKFLQDCADYYIRGTESTTFTENDLRICYAPYDLHRYPSKGFGPQRSKSMNQRTLVKLCNTFSEKPYGMIALAPKVQYVRQLFGIASISRTEVSDQIAYNVIGVFDMAISDTTAPLANLTVELLKKGWPYYSYVRWYSRLNNELLATYCEFTEYEKRAKLEFPHTENRLRTGIRGLFWENVLSEGHLAKVDVDRLRDRFASVGMNVTQLTAPDNTRRVRIQLSGPPRDPTPEEVKIFEQELGHLLPQPQA